MSYEGFVQILCKNGHLHEFDCYDDPTNGFTGDEWACPICGTKVIYKNHVDQTNPCEYEYCSLPEEKKQICSGIGCGYKEFEVAHEAVEEECRCCGHVEVIEPVRYKIPTGK